MYDQEKGFPKILNLHLVLSSLFGEVINMNQTILGGKVLLLFWDLLCTQCPVLVIYILDFLVVWKDLQGANGSIMGT